MKKDVIARFIALGVVLLNSVLTMFNINPIPFSENEIYVLVSALLTCIVSIYTTWKNNSVTSEAKLADKVMKALKNGEASFEVIEDLVDTAKDTLQDKIQK